MKQGEGYERPRHTFGKIISCVGSIKDFNSSELASYLATSRSSSETEERVANRREFNASSIDSRDKFSPGYVNCTGLVVVGRKKGTNENIALLTHQFPAWGSGEESKSNRVALHKILSSFKKQVEEGTIDTVIFGGTIDPSSRGANTTKEKYTRNYLKEVEGVRTIVQNTLGVMPHIPVGPVREAEKPDGGAVFTHVFFDTALRRFFIIRTSDIDDEIPGFSSGEARTAIEGAFNKDRK